MADSDEGSYILSKRPGRWIETHRAQVSPCLSYSCSPGLFVKASASNTGLQCISPWVFTDSPCRINPGGK